MSATENFAQAVHMTSALNGVITLGGDYVAVYASSSLGWRLYDITKATLKDGFLCTAVGADEAKQILTALVTVQIMGAKTAA